MVVFKVFFGATMVSALGYSVISKYFKDTYLKDLSFFCGGRILSTFAARIRSQILQSHLEQGRHPSLPPNGEHKLITQSHSCLFIPWQEDIWCNADYWSTYCSYFLLHRGVCLVSVALKNSACSISKYSNN